MKLQEFADFMKERHRIYLRKAAGEEAPWTEDEAMQRVYLTNVYRELDKVTVWIRENIREPYAQNENLWFMLCLARLINLPETLDDLIRSEAFPEYAWRPGKFVRVFERRKQENKPIFTTAYMLWGGHTKNIPKHEVTAGLLGRLWRAREDIEMRLHGSLEDAWKELTKYRGLSAGFIAYEIVTDLRYTHYLENAPDKKTWAFAGPGASRGLNWVYERENIARRLPEEQALEEMREVYAFVTAQWPQEWPELELREIEHSLCEFSKVSAFRYLGKKPKRWYKGGNK